MKDGGAVERFPAQLGGRFQGAHKLAKRLSIERIFDSLALPRLYDNWTLQNPPWGKVSTWSRPPILLEVPRTSENCCFSASDIRQLHEDSPFAVIPAVEVDEGAWIKAQTANNDLGPELSNKCALTYGRLSQGGLSCPAHLSQLAFHLVGLFINGSKGFKSHDASPARKNSQRPIWYVCRGIQFAPLVRLGVFILLLFGGSEMYLRNGRRLGLILAGVGLISGLAPVPWDMGICRECKPNEDSNNRQVYPHDAEIVPQKPLDAQQLLGYSNYMANVLNLDKQIAIVGALAEGSSIRSIERITGIHRDTIMRLGVKIGQGCTALMDAKMRNLPCTRLEMDEIWGFVGKKAKSVQKGDKGIGDVWTWCCIDAETKLVPTFMVGDRTQAAANAFVADVASRLAYRVQVSTDAFYAYKEAMKKSFGPAVDYGRIIKVYGVQEFGERRYSTPGVLSSEKKVMWGQPDFDLISTSYVERLNATTRLHMRRLTRLTLAFSKKRENFEAAVGLHFGYYNFVKRHNTLKCTPAMAAGVSDSQWSIGELVEAAA